MQLSINTGALIIFNELILCEFMAKSILQTWIWIHGPMKEKYREIVHQAGNHRWSLWLTLVHEKVLTVISIWAWYDFCHAWSLEIRTIYVALCTHMFFELCRTGLNPKCMMDVVRIILSLFAWVVLTGIGWCTLKFVRLWLSLPELEKVVFDTRLLKNLTWQLALRYFTSAYFLYKLRGRVYNSSGHQRLRNSFSGSKIRAVFVWSAVRLFVGHPKVQAG